MTESGTYTITHTPFGLDGTYEHWTVVDNTGRSIRVCATRAAAVTVVAALDAGQTPPAPSWPEPGSNVRTCHYCGLPIRGNRCQECV